MKGARIDPSLNNLQAGFQDYILGYSDRALVHIESTATLSAARRMDIYHSAYRLRLIEVLADTYERVTLYIGAESFDAAARAYIEQHPSNTRNLRDYGKALPVFLARYFADDLEVAELAEMDMRLRYAFDAADADALCMSDIAALQPHEWEDIIFALHPTASFQQFKWNTPAIWQRVSDDAAPPSAVLLPQSVEWLFWRKELQPHFRSLSSEEHAALCAIRDGFTFGALCALLAETYPALNVTTQIGGWLRAWLDDGVLSRVHG